jgi:hypothetical protein
VKHCQKARQLWTEWAEKSETLSKGKSTSDRVSRKQRDTVKRQGNFGQLRPTSIISRALISGPEMSSGKMDEIIQVKRCETSWKT